MKTIIANNCEPNNNDNRTIFEISVNKWEIYADSDKNNVERYHAGNTLATAIALSVLKKLINVSAQRDIYKMRVDVLRAVSAYDTIERSLQNTRDVLDKNSGELYIENIDIQLERAVIPTLRALTGGNGQDLINVAWIALLEESDAEPNKTIGWMTRPYTVRRLSGKVYSKTGHKKPEWIEAETTHVQNVYKKVRQYIEEQRGIKSASEKYSYIDKLEVSTDGLTERVYVRYHMIDIGAETDNGYTIDEYTEEKTTDIINRLNLTNRETTVLLYTLQGYGDTEIADILNVSQQRVSAIRKQILKAAVEIGLANTDENTDSRTKAAPKRVAMYDKNEPEKPIATFDSIAHAAKVTSLDKGNIGQCINGRRNSVNGYIFKHV